MAIDRAGARLRACERSAFAIRAAAACIIQAPAFPASLLACALLASCAAPQPPPVQADPQARALLQRRFDDPQLLRFIERALGHAHDDITPAAPLAPTAWDLPRLTLAAIYFHPDLQVARSQLALAQAHAHSARAAPAPSWGATLGRGAGAALASPWVVGAAVEFLLAPGGHRRWEIAQADELEKAARADLRQAGWQVRGRVLMALIDERSAQGRIAALQEQLALQSLRVEAAGRRIEAGEAPRSEQRREMAQRDLLAAALLLANGDRARARADLAQAIGVPLAALDAIRVADGTPALAAAVDEVAVEGPLRAEALQGRADVAEVLARVDAAQDELRAEASKRWPDIRIGPGYQFDLGANKYTVSAAFDWPRSADGPMREALARRDLACAGLLAIQAAAIARIDRALSDWRGAATSEADLRAALERAGLAERAAQAQFDAGGLDRPALLAARIDRIAAQASHGEAIVRQLRALAALEDALQRPLQGDPQDLLTPANLAAAGSP